MKITVAMQPTPIKKSITYPVLAQHVKNGHIVLFTDRHQGIVLRVGDTTTTTLTVGDYSENLYAVTNTDHWEILPAGTTITLEQT